MTKAESVYHKLKNEKPNLGILLNPPATQEAIEELEKLVGQELPADFKNFYLLANGFETSDYLFRVLPIEEIIQHKTELKANDFYLAEYLIYSDTWDIVLENLEYKIVNYNHKTGRPITLTKSVFEFIERYIEGDGIFGEYGLYDWSAEIESKTNNNQELYEVDELNVERTKEGNRLKLNRRIKAAYIFTIIMGLLSILIAWYFSHTSMIFLISIGIVAVLCLGLYSYIERLRRLTCPKCGNFDNSVLISKTEQSSELVPKDMKNYQTLFISKYKCNSCGHIWYVHKYESNRYDG